LVQIQPPLPTFEAKNMNAKINELIKIVGVVGFIVCFINLAANPNPNTFGDLVAQTAIPTWISIIEFIPHFFGSFSGIIILLFLIWVYSNHKNAKSHC
jgi:hypothetical protein